MVIWTLGSLAPQEAVQADLEVEPHATDLLHFLANSVSILPSEAGTYASFLTSVLVTNSVQLEVMQVPPSQVEVTWPITTQVLILQSSDSAKPGTIWSPVTAPVRVIDGHNSVTVPAAASCQFYRLVPAGF
jgi:hypothetical protein